MLMEHLADVLKINIGVMKNMYVKQKIKPIPPLQIGNDKLKPRFENKCWFKGLKDWFIGITINW